MTLCPHHPTPHPACPICRDAAERLDAFRELTAAALASSDHVQDDDEDKVVAALRAAMALPLQTAEQDFIDDVSAHAVIDTLPGDEDRFIAVARSATAAAADPTTAPVRWRGAAAAALAACIVAAVAFTADVDVGVEQPASRPPRATAVDPASPATSPLPGAVQVADGLWLLHDLDTLIELTLDAAQPNVVLAAGAVTVHSEGAFSVQTPDAFVTSPRGQVHVRTLAGVSDVEVIVGSARVHTLGSPSPGGSPSQDVLQLAATTTPAHVTHLPAPPSTARTSALAVALDKQTPHRRRRAKHVHAVKTHPTTTAHASPKASTAVLALDLQQARQLLANGNDAEARALLLKDDDGTWESRALLADAHLLAGDVDEALSAYDAAVARNAPCSVGAERAQLLTTHRPRQAQEAWSAVLAQRGCPAAPEALLALARMAVDEGRATALLKRLLRQHPNAPEAATATQMLRLRRENSKNQPTMRNILPPAGTVQ